MLFEIHALPVYHPQHIEHSYVAASFHNSNISPTFKLNLNWLGCLIKKKPCSIMRCFHYSNLSEKFQNFVEDAYPTSGHCGCTRRPCGCCLYQWGTYLIYFAFFMELNGERNGLCNEWFFVSSSRWGDGRIIHWSWLSVVSLWIFFLETDCGQFESIGLGRKVFLHSPPRWANQNIK